MKAHEAAAEAVAGELVQGGYKSDTVGDLSWIMLILDIFAELAQNCNFRKDPVKACDDCRKPGLIQRAALRGVCRRVMGRQAFREHGEAVHEALLRYGQTLDEAKLSEILEEL